MGSEKKLFLKEIEEDASQRNFETIKQFLTDLNKHIVSQSQLYGFIHFDYNFESAVTNQKVDHNLGEIPLDIIQTFLTGAGTITWNYATFTSETLDVTTTGACRVRGYLGTYKAGVAI